LHINKFTPLIHVRISSLHFHRKNRSRKKRKKREREKKKREEEALISEEI